MKKQVPNPTKPTIGRGSTQGDLPTPPYGPISTVRTMPGGGRLSSRPAPISPTLTEVRGPLRPSGMKKGGAVKKKTTTKAKTRKK